MLNFFLVKVVFIIIQICVFVDIGYRIGQYYLWENRYIVYYVLYSCFFLGEK